MIGAVIIAHSFVGKELIATAEYIVGKIEGITAVSINGETNAFEARKRVSDAIKQVSRGDGVLLLTDLFGGSPSNISFSFLNSEKIDVVTGVNLPMILTFWNKREDKSLSDLAKLIQLSGTRNIVIAKELLKERGAFGRRILKSDGRFSQK
ncbi:MAG: PTS fructose transporter subunit IIA [Deltaproteobacteria bacterium]|nr:PTS fructose transporter subunit IIA [Deltaproteobacteria bacterium]